MRVISLTGTVKFPKTCAAIGIFDGVHLGHQLLIKKMLAKAKDLHAKSLVITFFPHPAHVLRPDIDFKYLISLKARMQLLERLGVDICLVIPFTSKFSRIPPENFIKSLLVDRLGVKALFVGEDFRFGSKRSGDVALFKAMALEYGYEMDGIKAVSQDGEIISSTRIRKLVMQGDLKGAKKLLGRDFSCFGMVVKGEGRGKSLGFPTANVNHEKCILPPVGVYAVKVHYKNKIYPAVANLGFRPSFKEKSPEPQLEVHIFDFNKDLYGKEIDIIFIKRIRDEKKFASVEDLRLQIYKDAQKARSILETS